MKKLHRFVLLSPGERRLLLEAGILMFAFRLALWLLPSRTVINVARCHGFQSGEPTDLGTKQIGWAVEAVSRCVPKPTCLVKALTARVLLENAGFAARLHIGVAKTNDERFVAHAWVEAQGAVITGGSELERYSRLRFDES